MANDHNAALEQWKEFLESTPAYVERRFENIIRDLTAPGPNYSWGFTSPRIQLHCEVRWLTFVVLPANLDSQGLVF